MSKRDKELEKILVVMRRIDDLYGTFFTGNLNSTEMRRIKAYIRNRYKWFFDWMQEDNGDL